MLTASVGLQRRLGELARREKLDGVLAEGPLGALVGPALAERLGLPLVYLLGDCEVHRRRDQLTREQLYLSELEQWACERAARVLVPNAEVGQAACRHYGLRAPQVAAVPTRGVAPASDDEVARLLERLSLPSSPILVPAPELGDEERQCLLAADLGAPLVLVDRHTWASCPGGERRPRVLSRRPPRGPALGALLTAARSVLVADRTAEVLADVARLVRPGRVQFTDAWGSASVLLKLQPLVGSARVNSQ